MGLTLEPALKQATSAYKNITIEDFVDQLDRIDPAQTPLTTFSSNDVKLGATDRSWNVDSYPSPKGAVGRADGDAVVAGNIRDWSANIRKVGNIGQAFDEQYGTGWIAGQVPRIAGVRDLKTRSKADAFMMLKQHMECAFSSFDQVAVVDQGAGLGSIGAGYNKLVVAGNKYASASAFALGKASDIHFAPSGAVITGALSAVHSRSMWKNVAVALRTAAKKPGDWTLIAGLSLRQAVTDLTDPTTATATAAATGTSAVVGITTTQVKVISAGEQDNILGASIDVIKTDFGRIMVTDSDYIGTTTTDATGGALSAVNTTSAARGSATFQSTPKKGIIIRRGNTFKSWGVPPYSVKLGEDGSGDAFDAKCFALFGVRNPILAGVLDLT